MINLGKESKLEPAKVIQKATEFFGPGGLGLRVRRRTESSINFEGGGGYISVTANMRDSGSDVTILSQEWEYQAKQFLEEI